MSWGMGWFRKRSALERETGLSEAQISLRLAIERERKERFEWYSEATRRDRIRLIEDAVDRAWDGYVPEPERAQDYSWMMKF